MELYPDIENIIYGYYDDLHYADIKEKFYNTLLNELINNRANHRMVYCCPSIYCKKCGGCHWRFINQRFRGKRYSSSYFVSCYCMDNSPFYITFKYYYKRCLGDYRIPILNRR